MSKSPVFPSLDLTQAKTADEKTEGFFSTREFTSGTLQFSSSKNLKSLLAEMDVLRCEVEEKIRNSSRKTKDSSNDRGKSEEVEKEEEYSQKVKELENQSRQMLKMIRKEEEEHEKEKVKSLKEDIERFRPNDEKLKSVDEKENNPPVLNDKYNDLRCGFCDENQEKAKKYKEKYETSKEHTKRLASQIISLKKENRRLKGCLEDTSEQESKLISKNSMLQDDNKILAKEYTALKERFSRYQQDQDSKITALEEEMDHLSKTLSKFLSFLSLAPEYN